MSNHIRSFFGILFLSSLLVSGCALFNPHPGKSLKAVEERLQEQQTTRAYVTNAILYASETWDAYNSALKQHSTANISGGLVTTALAAGAVGAGAFGGSRDLVLGLGSGAGGTYAATTLLVSRPRQYVYVAGMDALNCAITATRPFDISQSDFTSLENTKEVNIFPLQSKKTDASILADQVNKLADRHGGAYQAVANALKAITIKIGQDEIAFSYKDLTDLLLNDIAWLTQIDLNKLAKSEDRAEATKIINELRETGVGHQKVLSKWNSIILEAEVVSFRSMATLARVNTILTNAAQAITPSQDLKKDAVVLLGECRMAAQKLADKVTQVRAEVSRQILRTEPDLTILASQMGVTLPKLTQATSSAPTPAPDPAAPNKPETIVPKTETPTVPTDRGSADFNTLKSELDGAAARFGEIGRALADRSTLLETLRAATENLDRAEHELHTLEAELAQETAKVYAAITPVRGIIDRVNRDIGNLSLTGCVVKGDVGAITVFPANPVPTMPGAKNQLWVQGGKPPYEIIWPLPSDGDNITANPKIVDGDSSRRFVIEVVVDPKAMPRSRTFVVKDMAGFEKAIVLDIQSLPGK